MNNILISSLFLAIETAPFCRDPLNLQQGRADVGAGAVTVTGGIVDCVAPAGATLNCGIVMSSGAGICTTNTAAAPGTGIFFQAPAYADTSALNAAGNGVGITSCWNPSVNAQVITTGLTATNVILACYTNNAGVGSAIVQAIGTGTTPSASPTPLTSVGSYCFTTNCNRARYVSAGGSSAAATIHFNIASILIGCIAALIATF